MSVSSPDTSPSAPGAVQRSLRRSLRAQRAALAPAQRSKLDAKIQRAAHRQLIRWQPRTVAAYWSTPAEVSVLPLLRALHRRGVRLALPALQRHRPGVMVFRRWRPGQPLCRNRWHIPEPCSQAARVWRREIDLVLLPLVGFDSTGQRLGMGGGYYDRYFAHKRWGALRPRLVGIAYSLQEVATLPWQPWDIALDSIVTENGWRHFPSGAISSRTSHSPSNVPFPLERSIPT